MNAPLGDLLPQNDFTRSDRKILDDRFAQDIPEQTRVPRPRCVFLPVEQKPVGRLWACTTTGAPARHPQPPEGFKYCIPPSLAVLETNIADPRPVLFRKIDNLRIRACCV
jgi:hypothetical protein